VRSRNIVAVDTQQCLLCNFEIHATANNRKISSVAQRFFYGKFYVAGNNKAYLVPTIFVGF